MAGESGGGPENREVLKAAERAGQVARVALIVAAMGFALGVLGLFLPIS